MFQQYLQATPQYGERVFIADNAQVLCDVRLDDDVSVWHGAVIRGDVQHIHVGARSNIQDNSTCHVASDSLLSESGGIPLIIGKEVTVGHNAVLHACRIGNRCLIGIGAILLDDAEVEDNVIIGAGCLVPPHAHLEANHLYLGAPAKKIRPLRAKEIEDIAISARHYVALKDAHLEKASKQR